MIKRCAFAIIGFLLISFFSPGVSQAATYTIGMVAFVDNSDYQASRNSFETTLKQKASNAGFNVKFIYIEKESDKEAFLDILRQTERKVDIFFVAGTPNAMLLKEAGITKPVIFSAVADPLKAKLVKSLSNPDTNFTGTHCAVSEELQLKILISAMPSIKTIGLLYNNNDPAPISQAENWKKGIQSKGLKVKEFFIPQSVASAEELAQASKVMIGQADVIVTTADAKIAMYGEGMLKVADENNMPVYAALLQQVDKGAFMSYGFNFVEAAKLSVAQAVSIFNGRSPKSIPVLTYAKYKLKVNSKALKKFNNLINTKILKAAEVVN